MADKATSEGLTPLGYMLSLLQAEDASKDDKMWAAERAAPYMHPRLASVEQKVTGELIVNDGVNRPPRMTRDEWLMAENVEAPGRPATSSH